MRITIELADDVAAAVERIRREGGVGLSEVVNGLIRSSLVDAGQQALIGFPTYDMGIEMDISNVGKAIAAVEQRKTVH